MTHLKIIPKLICAFSSGGLVFIVDMLYNQLTCVAAVFFLDIIIFECANQIYSLMKEKCSDVVLMRMKTMKIT